MLIFNLLLQTRTNSKLVSYQMPLIGVLTVLCMLNVSAQENPSPSFDAFFQTFKEKREGIGSLQATFTQKTILPQEIITTEGSLAFSKPRRILLLTKDPDRATLVDNRQGYEYDAEIKQMTLFSIEDHPRANIFFLGFDDDPSALKSAYDVVLFETDDSRGHQGLKITPKPDGKEEAYFIEANLYLRKEDFLPYRIHIVNDQESELYIDVREITPQSYQDLNSVRFFVPEGVKVIENDRVVETIESGGRYIPSMSHGVLLQEKELPEVHSSTAGIPHIEE